MNNKLFKFVSAFLSFIILMSNIAFATETIISGCELTSPENIVTYPQDKNGLATAIREAIENRVKTFTIHYSSTSELLKSDVELLINELLELSFAETNSPTQGDYLRYSYKSYGFSFISKQDEDSSNYTNDITLEFDYRTTKEQEEELTTEITKLIQNFGFDENTTDREKLDTIYSYITYNVKYDYDNMASEDYSLQHTAYAALIHNKAVCDGYALLFYRLAKECGIDSRVITGSTPNERDLRHAWNIVKIDNYYYYVDSTWDAETIEYGYYLKGTDDFLEHTNDPQFKTSDFKNTYPIPTTGLTINPSDELEENNFKYIAIAGKAYITKYTGTASNVIVPSTLGNCHVIQVNREAFNTNQYIKTLTISEGIRSIDGAIVNCYELETINFPSTLNISFSTTTGLSGIPINCFKLKNITVAEGNTSLKTVDGVLYTADMKSILLCPAGYEKDTFTIPNGVQTIAGDAFSECTNIEKIIMPDTVKTISHWAFSCARNLEEVNISENCEAIGQFAFSNTSVKELHIPAATITIMDNAFGLNCPLENVTVDENNPIYFVEDGLLRTDIAIYKYLLGRNESTYTIPEGITHLCQYAFEDATNLTTINLPNSLETINAYSFEDCTNLVHITIPNNVTDIETGALSNCISLASIIIPNNVKNIKPQLISGNIYCTIYGENNSIAHQYGINNNINFKTIDDFKCTDGHQFEEQIEVDDPLIKVYRHVCKICGDKSKTYTVQYKDIQNTKIELDFTTAVYTGKEIEQTNIKITDGEKVLVPNVDYVISYYTNNLTVGTATVFIDGIGEYIGQTFTHFEIKPIDISNMKPNIQYTSTEYDKNMKQPSVTIEGLESGYDYEVLYQNNIDAGTATVIINGINNCTGQIITSFEITPIDISNMEPFVEYTSTEYDGTEKQPFALLEGLELDCHYKVDYQNNINKGTATMIITGIGNCTGQIIKTFEIMPKSISFINPVLEYTSTQYDGTEKRPSVTLEGLKLNHDYTVNYIDNINVGGAGISIKGINNYDGEIYTYFAITPLDISTMNPIIEYTSTEYDGNEKRPSVTLKELRIDYDYRVDYQYNVNVGTATIIITGEGNYIGEIIRYFNINLKLSAPKSVTLSLTDKHNDVQIDWEKVSKASGYTIYYKRGNSSYTKLTTIHDGTITSYNVYHLSEGSQYTFKVVPLKLTSDRKYIEENTYKTASINTLRNLSAPSKVSLSLYGHNDIKASWNKVSNANGYYVYYKKSSSSNYTYAGSTTGTSFEQKNLSANTKYTFKVVPYYIVGSKTYADDSSKTASISTLKKLSAPSKVTLSLYGYDDVKVSWKKVSGAKSYNVYYKESNSSNYTYAGNTTGTSFKQKNLEDGVKYKFKVVPCHKVNSKMYEVDSSKTATIYTLKKVKTPSVKKSGKDKVKVSWSNIDGESGYEISMSTSKKGTKVVAKYSTTKGKSKTITTKKGKKYYYKVRAYKIVDKKKIYAPWSSTKSFKLK